MDETKYRASRMFRVLANPLAYRIITLLREGPAHPCALAQRLARPPQSIARVGRELKLADLISFTSTEATKNKPGVEYRLKDASLAAILDSAEDYVHRMGNLV